MSGGWMVPGQPLPDAAAVLAALLEDAEVLAPEWDARDPSDPGHVLLSLVAAATARTLAAIDAAPRRLEEGLTRLLGVRRRPAAAARAWVCVRPRRTNEPILVPAGTEVTTRSRVDGEPLRFRTLRDLACSGAVPTHLVRVGADGELAAAALRPGDVPGLFVVGSPARMRADGPWDEVAVYVAVPEGLPGVGSEARVRLGRPEAERAVFASLWTWSVWDGAGWRPWVPISTADAPPPAQATFALPQSEPLARTALEPSPPHDRPHDPEEPAAPRAGWLAEVGSHLLGRRVVRGLLDWAGWYAARRKDVIADWHDDRGRASRPLEDVAVEALGAHALRVHLKGVPSLAVGWGARVVWPDAGVDWPSAQGAPGRVPPWRWWVVDALGRRQPIAPTRVHVEGTAVSVAGPLVAGRDGVVLEARLARPVAAEDLLPGLRASWEVLRPLRTTTLVGPALEDATPVALPASPWQPVAGLPPAPGHDLLIGSVLLADPVAPASGAAAGLVLALRVEGDDVEVAVDVLGPGGFVPLDVACAPGEAPVGGRITLSGGERVRIPLRLRHGATALGRALGEAAGWLRVRLVRHGDGDVRCVEAAVVPARGGQAHVSRWVAASAVLATAERREIPGARVATRRVGAGPPEPAQEDPGLLDALRGRQPGETWLLRLRGGAGPTSLVASRSWWQSPGARWSVLGATAERAATLQARSWSAPAVWANGDEAAAVTVDLPAAPATATRWLRVRVPDADPERVDHDLWPAALLVDAVPVEHGHVGPAVHASGDGGGHQWVALPGAPLRADPASLVVEVRDGSGWSRWERAPDDELARCGGEAKVFAFDPVDGGILFGDGRHGACLPVGVGNVRVSGWETVAGANANLPPGALVEVPAFAGRVLVGQPWHAVGGEDEETEAAARARVPEVVSARDRAVTRQDIAALARRASSEVARVWVEGATDGAPERTVRVWLLPQRGPGGAWPTARALQALVMRVAECLRARLPADVVPVVHVVRRERVAVRARVVAVGPGVRGLCEEALREALSPWEADGPGPGRGLTALSLAARLARVSGVLGVRAVRVGLEGEVGGDALRLPPGSVVGPVALDLDLTSEGAW